VATGAGNAEKDTLPQAAKWGGAGKRAQGLSFSGPVWPVTNSKNKYQNDVTVKKERQNTLKIYSFQRGIALLVQIKEASITTQCRQLRPK